MTYFFAMSSDCNDLLVCAQVSEKTDLLFQGCKKLHLKVPVNLMINSADKLECPIKMEAVCGLVNIPESTR